MRHCPLVVVLLLSARLVSAQAQDAAPPDVLFISIDDLNDWVGVLGGHPQAITPNIDALAARGMLFTNAHAPSALCNPSRTAIFTGLAPSTTGVYGNAPNWRTVDRLEGIPTIPKYFQQRGYRTFGAGKLFHAHTYSDGGFIGYNDITAWDAYYPSLERQLPDEIRPLNRPANGNPFSRNIDWAGLVAEDSAMGDGQVVGWGRRQLLADSGSPRFVAIGIYRPHPPWYVPQKYLDLYPLDSLELPHVLETDLDDVPDAALIGAFDGNMPPMLYHEWGVASGQWKEAVQAYLASVSFADAMVGQLLDALDRSGRADNTIIVLWSDHGWHLGEKLRWRKSTVWEESTRVPFIVVAPGVTTPGSLSDRAVSLMDIYPTLTELAGLETPGHVEGTSLVPLIIDQDAPWEHVALSTFGYMNHAVRSDRYRYIRYYDGSEELYDHDADPQEWINLAADPDFSDIKNRLAEWLPDWDEPDAILDF
ncbi:MAG: sulfatase [Gammaproteobacteria bacterium]|jgi:arylsulfatase A-like enzyme